MMSQIAAALQKQFLCANATLSSGPAGCSETRLQSGRGLAPERSGFMRLDRAKMGQLAERDLADKI